MNAPNLRVLQDEYVFDDRLADCHTCELQKRRAQTMCLAQRPAEFNGLMIVGEGPGSNEARLKTPFVGTSGQLLDRLLQLAGIERKHTWITNATLCFPDLGERYSKPKQKGKKAGRFTDDFPNAVPSCSPRLHTEIEIARPRVILALGDAALTALTGGWVDVETKELVVCETCAGTLHLPWWKCGVCKAANLLAPFTAKDATVYGIPCHQCQWIPSETAGVKVFKTKKKCPSCDGKKYAKKVVPQWLCDHRISFVAGGVFRAQQLGYPEGVEYIIPTYHPSFLLRKAETKGDRAMGGQFLASAALEHIKKAARLLTEEPRWSLKYRVVRTVDELRQYLREKPAHARFTTVDIETDAKEEFDVTRIKCVGLHHEHHEEAAVIVTEDVDVEPRRALHRNHPLVAELCAWLVDAEQEKTLQNGAYDTQVFWAMWGIEVAGWTRDTLLAHNTVAPDEPHDLSHIAFTYSDVPPWKPPKKKGGIDSFQTDDELYHYNATDCVATTVSMQFLEREMAKERTEFVHQLDITKTVIARGMDRAGLPVDLDRWNLRRNEVAEKEAIALNAMRAIIDKPDFNPNSHPQLSWALFDPSGPLKLIPGTFTETGAPGTDASALAKHHEHEFVQHLLRYREFGKLHGTYFGRIDPSTGQQTSGIIIQADRRLYCTWNPRGARTGRWSSSPNFQNWPMDMRDVVFVPTGRKLIGADLSQAELRVIAALSGDEAMIAKCMNAREDAKLDPQWDPHSYVASFAFPNYVQLFAQGEKAVCKALREVAKTVIYAMNYGAGAETIWRGIYDKGYSGPPISVEMVRRVMEAYFRAFPRVREYVERTLGEALRSGYVRDALIGRLRVFPLGDVDSTIAKNFGIQATVASMMDMSLVELATNLPHVDPTAMILAQVHDAVYLEVDEDRADDCAKLLSDAMSQSLQLVEGAPFMDFPATAKIGDRWSEVS